ncbi:MAG: hypothetical protein WBA54_11490 [Acidaminobacteraceae bacterium]
MQNDGLNLKVLDLLEEFENRLEGISALPLTNKIMIDRGEFLDLIREINILLPEEYQHVKWIRSQKNQIIDDAQKNATTILQKAQSQENQILANARDEEERIMIEVKEKMDQLLNENKLVELAEERAKEIIDEAENFADDIKESGYEYVENLLNNLGLNLQDMMGKVESNIKELTNYK